MMKNLGKTRSTETDEEEDETEEGESIINVWLTNETHLNLVD